MSDPSGLVFIGYAFSSITCCNKSAGVSGVDLGELWTTTFYHANLEKPFVPSRTPAASSGIGFSVVFFMNPEYMNQCCCDDYLFIQTVCGTTIYTHGQKAGTTETQCQIDAKALEPDWVWEGEPWYRTVLTNEPRMIWPSISTPDGYPSLLTPQPGDNPRAALFDRPSIGEGFMQPRGIGVYEADFVSCLVCVRSFDEHGRDKRDSVLSPCVRHAYQRTFDQLTKTDKGVTAVSGPAPWSPRDFSVIVSNDHRKGLNYQEGIDYDVC